MGLQLSYRFKESQMQNMLELLNLTIQLFMTYLLLLFTDFVDQPIQQDAGNIWIYLMISSLGAKIFTLVLDVVYYMKLRIKRWYRREKLLYQRE